MARYGGETFNLNYRLKFFFLFSFFSQPAGEQEASRQATQRISINYPRLRFPRSQAVLKERGRPGGTDDGGSGALELGDEEKKSPRRAMQSGRAVGRSGMPVVIRLA